MSKQEFSYEEGIKELEKLVSLLESQELPLEKAIAVYEKGMKISAQLSRFLQNAEEKVKILSRAEEGNLKLTEFSPEGEENSES